MWSPWKCEITTMSTAFGSKPAAAMLLANCPTLPLLDAKAAAAVAGVDHDQLAAGIDDQRRELDRHLVLRHERLFERGVDFVLLGVEHEGIAQREVVDAVGDDGHLGVADLVAIETRRLLVGRRRGGPGWHCGKSGVAASAAAPASA